MDGKRFVNWGKVRNRLWLLLAVMLVGVACRGEQQRTIVVTRIVTENGEPVIVTRLVQETITVPVTQTPAPGDPEPVVLDVALSGFPAELDPLSVVDDTDITLVENLFVGLTRYNHATDSVDPQLAISWEVSGGGRTWTFQLRDDVYWLRTGLQQEGQILGETGPEIIRPVVAGDVVTAVHRLCAENRSADVFIFFIIAGCERVHGQAEPTEADLNAIGVKALNDTTLEFSLTKPAGYFLTMTTMWLLRPVPGDIIAEFEEEFATWSTIENVVTSGPFIPGLGTAGEVRTVLNRNPFWPMPFDGNVDIVNIWWMETDSAYEMWLAKNTDISPLPADKREEIETDRSRQNRLQLISKQRVFYLSFNFDSPVFSDETVRRAFGAAIDRELLIEDVFGGRGEPARHFSPPGTIGAPPADIVGTGFNPDLARIEMANSSFRDCRFIPEIRYLVGTSDLDLFQAETIRSSWTQILDCQEEQIVIDQVQFGTLLADTRQDAGNRRPDIWNLGWASYYPDAHNWLSDVLHCSDSENRQNRSCSGVDDVLRQAAIATDQDTRWDLYRQAERLFFGEGGIEPITPLLVQADFLLVHPWVIFTPAHFGGEQFDTYQVMADEKELERGQ
jgi:ABC-type oligopeptide transport system substrate-binding subunit